MTKPTIQPERRMGPRWSVAAVALGSLLLLAVIAAPADARGKPRLVPVSGDAVPSECNEGVGVAAIELVGDLTGCLTFLSLDFECEELNGFALYSEVGRESFSGTLNGVEGTFATRYTLEATYTSGACSEFDAGGFPFEKQLTGGCDHRVVAGTGVFRRARGLVTFYDVIPEPGQSGASNYLYSGEIRVRG